MSNSEEISEQLSAYLDGELSGEESRRIDEMLADDPALSDELESLREVRQLLQSLPSEQAPDRLLDTVLAPAQRRRTTWWMGYLARAAVIVLAVGIGVIVTARMNRPAQQNGTQTPLYPETPPLAKSGLVEDKSIAASPEVTNVLINTDNLVLAQREIEGVFLSNSVVPVMAKEEPVRVAKGDPREHRGRANFYDRDQVTPNQVRYELAITESQMRQIVSELNGIRARQNVAQHSAGDSPRDKVDTISLAKAYSTAKSGTRAGAVAESKKSVDAARERDDVAPRPPSSEALARSQIEQQPETGEIRRQRVVFGQTTTASATANVRQLVVILNVVGKQK